MTSNKEALVKIEGNICEYPFFILSKSDGQIESKEYYFSPVVLEDGKIEERKLTLTSSEGYGLPLAFDMDVLIAISQIGTESNIITDRIYFTLYDIAKKLNLGPSKVLKIKKSIKRMYKVDCLSEYCILLIDKKNKKKKYLSKEDYFHIFDSVGFLDTKQEKNKRLSREYTYARFNEFFIQNFFSGYFQYVNFSIYMSLEIPTAKRLYLYLSKKRFGRTEFKISITKLANVLPIESKEFFKIRQTLREACEHLIDQKVISDYKLEKGAMDITFYFPAQEIKGDDVPLLEGKDSAHSTGSVTTSSVTECNASSPTKEKLLNLPEEQRGVYENLVKFGVSKGVAKQLLSAYPLDDIKNQMDWINYRKGKNLQAILVTAIKEDWAMPGDVLKQKEKEETENKVKRLISLAKNAKYIILSGERYKITSVFNDNAVEFLDKGKTKRVYVINQDADCSFE